MFQTSEQERPGIVIFFTQKANTQKLNELLIEKYFVGDEPPIEENRILILPLGGYAVGLGGIQFYCYRLPSKKIPALKPAFPFTSPYDSVVWIKNLDGNFLWKNWHYNEDGSFKEK